MGYEETFQASSWDPKSVTKAMILT